MHDWPALARTVRDYFPYLVFGAMAAVMLLAWFFFETWRRSVGRDELRGLHRKVDRLEASRAYSYRASPAIAEAAPYEVVLSPRWVRRGTAATTSDGGCLLIVDAVMPGRRTASVTVRVDGWPGARHDVRKGQPVEFSGRMGTYSIELENVGSMEARLSVTLRSRHAREAASN